jgi:hypothetical protein
MMQPPAGEKNLFFPVQQECGRCGKSEVRLQQLAQIGQRSGSFFQFGPEEQKAHRDVQENCM